MEPGRFFASSTVLVVAGKGGVGKTVTAATLAVAAARTGLDVLFVEVAGRSASAPYFGVDEITYRERLVQRAGSDRGEIRARSLTPDDALVEWLADHGFGRLARRMARTGILEIVATATPGIKDLLVLGKVKQLAGPDGTDADLVVVDAPAAGHALSFLRAPAQLARTATSGTIHRQAVEALELLTDPRRTRVTLVTIPEETPVNELVETAFALEETVGVALTPVVVNAVAPPADELSTDPAADPASAAVDETVVDDLATVAAFRRRRRALHEGQLRRLADRLPLEQILLPAVPGAAVDPTAVEALADVVLAGVAALPDHAT